MNKTIPELFTMLKAAEVKIKKEHQVLMVNKTTRFKKKRANGRRGTSRRIASKLLLKGRNPSLDLSLRLSASTAKGLVTGSGTAPSIWRIRRMEKLKVYLIYMLFMCTLLMLIVAPGYLILVLLLIFATRNRGY